MEQNYHGEGPSWNADRKQKYVEIGRRPLELHQKLIIIFTLSIIINIIIAR